MEKRIRERRKLGKRKQTYAIDELYYVYHGALTEIHKKYTEEAKEISDAQRFLLIQKGEFKLKERTKGEVNQLDKIHQVFDFWPHECDAMRDQSKVDEIEEKLTITYTSIKDSVALGDEDMALSILKEFRSFANGLVK